tara:strand:+ start:5883 stop:6056 length:174 start_codon:yes stop_codon:yes gene_type:complete
MATFFIKGYIIEHYKTLAIDADTEWEAIIKYQNLLEDGNIDQDCADLEVFNEMKIRS